MPYFIQIVFALNKIKNFSFWKKFDPAKRLPASEFQQNVGKKSRMRKESILVLDS